MGDFEETRAETGAVGRRSADPVGVSRRQFLLRTGTLGAAATVALYPSLARAAGALDPAIETIAGPALQILARDTISGLIAFQVPGPDKYSQAQGVTDPRPGGVDAKAPELLLHALDDFLPVPDSYVQAMAASFTTAVSDIPIPLELLGPLAQLGEQYAAQMDDALRAFVQSDAAVPLSLLIALMLNFLATSVSPASVGGAIPASPFASLSFDQKGQAFSMLENADPALLAVLDGGAPQPLKDSLSGLLKFVGGALMEFAGFTSYTEFDAFDPATRTLTGRPVGWDLSNYMPGRTTSADGWDEFKGYFQGRSSTTGPSSGAVPVAPPTGARRCRRRRKHHRRRRRCTRARHRRRNRRK